MSVPRGRVSVLAGPAPHDKASCVWWGRAGAGEGAGPFPRSPEPPVLPPDSSAVPRPRGRHVDPSPRGAFLPVCPSIPRRAAPACPRPAHLSFSMPALPEALPGHAARVHVGSLVSAAAPWGLWRVFWTWPAGAPVGGGEGTATCPGASGRQVAGALILPQLCRAAVTPSGSTRGRGRRAWGTGSGKLRLEGGTQVLQQGQGSGAWCRVCSVWKEACRSCDGVGHGASPPSHFRLRAGTHSQAPYVFLGFFFFTLDKHFNKSWETFSLLHHHSERLLSRFWARGGPTRG